MRNVATVSPNIDDLVAEIVAALNLLPPHPHLPLDRHTGAEWVTREVIRNLHRSVQDHCHRDVIRRTRDDVCSIVKTIATLEHQLDNASMWVRSGLVSLNNGGCDQNALRKEHSVRAHQGASANR